MTVIELLASLGISEEEAKRMAVGALVVYGGLFLYDRLVTSPRLRERLIMERWENEGGRCL